jgi:phosphate butyryltransferase
MVIKNFNELIKKVQNFTESKRVILVCAHDKNSLEAVQRAEKEGIVSSILIGNKEKIKQILDELSFEKNDKSIIDLQSDSDAANKSVEMIREHKADFIMKGKIQTSDLLKAVVNKETGLRTKETMSHIAFIEIPTYHKLLVITDAGMMLYPDIEGKKAILENSVKALLSLGYKNPKVAIIAAVEKVNPKMQESVDGEILKKMNENGEIKNCIIEGPISYDLAMSRRSAEIKNYTSPVTGDVDIMVVPNITTGNILVKSLVYSAKSKIAGLITGAKVPIVLTSRGATSEEKYLSLALCASLA